MPDAIPLSDRSCADYAVAGYLGSVIVEPAPMKEFSYFTLPLSDSGRT